MQGGKDEELDLAGYEDSKNPVSQAGGLGRFQPPLRFTDHALSEEAKEIAEPTAKMQPALKHHNDLHVDFNQN